MSKREEAEKLVAECGNFMDAYIAAAAEKRDDLVPELDALWAEELEYRRERAKEAT